MPMLDVVFDRGVFRPVKPVVLPDRYPSMVFFDEPPAKEEPPPLPVAAVPNRLAPVVPDLDDYPDLEDEDINVALAYAIEAPPTPR